MQQYKIEIEETVSQIFEVEATTIDEAIKIAKDNYKNEKFILEPGNLMDAKFRMITQD